MNNRRVFIAINFPEQVKNRLLKYQDQWADMSMRWTRKDNLHLTLVFIGYVTDDEMLEICQLAKEIGQKHQPFEINFDKICLGPPNRPPRMIWITGQPVVQLAQLRNDLEKTIFNSKEVDFKGSGYKLFNPHITLARFGQNQLWPKGQKLEVDQKIDLAIPVETIEVMESHISRGGAEYSVLETIDLGL